MKSMWIGILLAIVIDGSAVQIYNVKNGAEVLAVIYKSGLSRISLEDDRIAAIKGVAGEFQLDKNEDVGDIYIKPTATRASDTIDLFIQSEKGNTYALRLKTSSEKPESISLVANDLSSENKDTFKVSSNAKQSEVIDLLKQVSSGADIKGYTVEVFSEPSKLKLKSEVISIVEKIYKGRLYKVEVIKVENNSDRTITVQDRDLADVNNILAVSIESHQLPDNSYTMAYRVIAL